MACDLMTYYIILNPNLKSKNKNIKRNEDRIEIKNRSSLLFSILI